MGTGRGAEAQTELGSRGVRRHAAGVCKGRAAALAFVVRWGRRRGQES